MTGLTIASDSFLSDAGWLFFAAWSVVVGAVSLTAFRRDLFPSKTQIDGDNNSMRPEPIRRTPNR